MEPKVAQEILDGFASALHAVLDDPNEVAQVLQLDDRGEFADPETQAAFAVFCLGVRFQQTRDTS